MAAVHHTLSTVSDQASLVGPDCETDAGGGWLDVVADRLAGVCRGILDCGGRPSGPDGCILGIAGPSILVREL